MYEIVTQIKRLIEHGYGELTVKVQDGKVVHLIYQENIKICTAQNKK